VSVHKVPVNAIWVVIPICAVFTFWAQVEVVIIALCTTAMYVTYGLVVAACLWGKQSTQSLIDGQPPKQVSRVLCAGALAWIAGILALLFYMTAISMSHHALVVAFWLIAAVSACTLIFFITRRLSPKADLSPAE